MSDKPLGGKSYGSIPHLPTSQVKSDKVVPEGQKRIATEEPRDDNDTIIVQYKYDGSCVSVAKIDDQIIPLIRAGYRADTSPHEQHRHFAHWVFDRMDDFERLLDIGERVCGEWLLQAHGTKYDFKVDHGYRNKMNYLFLVFDLFTDGERNTWRAVQERLSQTRHIHAVENVAKGPTTIDWLKGNNELENNYLTFDSGHPIQPRSKHEGFVWRVERNGEVDFLCKWVRPGKTDGCYLPGIDSNDVEEPVWNVDPNFI
jgi:hypothetical protein